MTSFRWGGASDTGRVREGNEDYVLVSDGLFAVADGMGGHRGGEIASHLAIDTLQARFDAPAAAHTTDALVAAVEDANRALVSRSGGDPQLEGMGTTLCALALVRTDEGDMLGVVNVGDSRMYLLKEGVLQQVTEDHSLVATLERQGKLTAAEAAVHPQRNILTRALGIEARVMVDSWEIRPRVGDRYVLCSDGLFNEVDDARIAATLRKLADPAEAAHELVRLANESGGRDNISAVVVDVVEGSTAGLPPAGPSGAAAGASGLAGAGPSDLVSDRVRAADRPSAEGGHRGRRRRRAEGGGTASRSSRRRWFTWRVALFVVIFLAIVGVAIGGIYYSATNTYYVGFRDDAVVLYQGRPGGLLWVQPTVEETTGLQRRELSASAVIDIERHKEFGSLDAARGYVANLRDQVTATTTTTTTSTVPLPPPPTSPTGPTVPADGLTPTPTPGAPGAP